MHFSNFLRKSTALSIVGGHIGTYFGLLACITCALGMSAYATRPDEDEVLTCVVETACKADCREAVDISFDVDLPVFEAEEFEIAEDIVPKSTAELIIGFAVPLAQDEEAVSTTVTEEPKHALNAAAGEDLYSQLTSEEVRLLATVIQHEVGNLSEQYRIYLAELLYNRLVSPDFPDDVKSMLLQRGQFQGASKWLYNGSVVVDDISYKVIEDVFKTGNPSHDGIAYYNPLLSSASACEWFESTLEFIFEYTEESWGVEYPTRFFKFKDSEV